MEVAMAEADRFYVKLREAPDFLKSRHHLRGSVEQWWQERGFKFPDVFMNRNGIGFMSRHVATARYEDCAFILLAERAGLTPVWSTYVRDKFVDRSPVKYSYVRPRLIVGFGRRSGSPIVKKLDHVHPKAVEGVPIDRIVSKDGEGLVNWHRRLLEMVYPGALVTDLSDIYQACEGARGYYPLLLSLGIAHGVFFEDFHGGETGEELRRFTQNVFEPAFDEVANLFGVRPIITPLPWWKELGYYVAPELACGWRTHQNVLKHLLI